MNVYNVYLLPTLLFVAQLERVPRYYEELGLVTPSIGGARRAALQAQ